MWAGASRGCRAPPQRAPPALVGVAVPAVAFALTVEVLWTIASIATFTFTLAIAVVPLPPRAMTVIRTFVGPARISTAVSVSIPVPSPSTVIIAIVAVFSPPRSVVFIVGPPSSFIVVIAPSHVPFRYTS